MILSWFNLEGWFFVGLVGILFYDKEFFVICFSLCYVILEFRIDEVIF